MRHGCDVASRAIYGKFRSMCCFSVPSLTYFYSILDPLIFDLCDPSIRRSPVVLEFNGRQVPSSEYDRPFDQRYIIHAMGILLSVVKFGGQGLTKIARGTLISRSAHAAVRERARSSA